ncbi:hypothetical protein ACIRU3_06100 [Streptomyces sp. NPDC101151]|uniref:hypothetical protein n=1 Tax=Streptomyces sp. NPDC101151 TaxID=3366115 RepID=UPI0038232751
MSAVYPQPSWYSDRTTSPGSNYASSALLWPSGRERLTRGDRGGARVQGQRIGHGTTGPLEKFTGAVQL